MTKHPTTIRRVVREEGEFALPVGVPYLAIPDNPAARAAMVERVCKTLWPDSTVRQVEFGSFVRDVVEAALTPTPRKRRAKS